MIGVLYPRILISSFNRHWEALDTKQKFKHFLGFKSYTVPLFEVVPLYEAQYTFQEFFENSLMSIDFVPHAESMARRYGTQDMKALCTILAKFLMQQFSKQ